jgi:phosphopantothenoylcysteine decarboxylase/phosphopantothenate--cysteine ligase
MRLKILIASGPTQEPLDPVRYLSNYSTGTMGRCLFEAAREKHKVTWIQCPKDAQTARELLALLKKKLPQNDVLIMAAAVCDVRPEKVETGKIKKERLEALKLVKNPDILAELANKKKKSQVFIGFGLETGDVLRNGLSKLRKKNLELILLQQVTIKKNPFGEKLIDAAALDSLKNVRRFKRSSKETIARYLIGKAESFAAQKRV